MVPPDEYKEYHENVLQSHRHKQLNTQLQVQYNRVHWGARRGNMVTHNARKPFGWGAFSASSLSKTEHYSPAVGWDVLYVRCLFIRPWCSLFYSIRIRDIDITRRRHHNTGSLLHEVPASDPPHSAVGRSGLDLRDFGHRLSCSQLEKCTLSVPPLGSGWRRPY